MHWSGPPPNKRDVRKQPYNGGMRKTRVRTSKKEFTPEQRETWNAYKRDYYRKHSAVIIQQNSKWRQHNRALVSGRQQTYRERMLAIDPDWERRASYKKRYGLTLAEYDEMLAQQQHRCAVCLGGPRGRKRFHVDHDHQTGEIRGLLCWRCNSVLGNVEENADVLLRMIAYLSISRPAGKGSLHGKPELRTNRRDGLNRPGPISETALAEITDSD